MPLIIEKILFVPLRRIDIINQEKFYVMRMVIGIIFNYFLCTFKILSIMKQIISLICCPTCLCCNLQSTFINKDEQVLLCQACGGIYPIKNSIPQLIDLRALIDLPFERLATWYITQQRGIKEYAKNDSASCSVSSRNDVGMFRDFMNLKGKDVLDVGSGSYALPGYAQNTNFRFFIGLDPVSPTTPQDFTLANALAEQLPFQNSEFDVLIFATSLDHCIDIFTTASESSRVLRPNGRIYIWTALFHDLTMRGQQFKHPLLGRVGRVSYDSQLHFDTLIESHYKLQKKYEQKLLEIDSDPERFDRLLVDQFHFQHLNREMILEAFGNANMCLTEEIIYTKNDIWDGVFFCFEKTASAYHKLWNFKIKQDIQITNLKQEISVLTQKSNPMQKLWRLMGRK